VPVLNKDYASINVTSEHVPNFLDNLLGLPAFHEQRSIIVCLFQYLQLNSRIMPLGILVSDALG
ncbi:uncharacterized protein METZ01_LOCUS123043, partial [marine metagenome]